MEQSKQLKMIKIYDATYKNTPLSDISESPVCQYI